MAHKTRPEIFSARCIRFWLSIRQDYALHQKKAIHGMEIMTAAKPPTINHENAWSSPAERTETVGECAMRLRKVLDRVRLHICKPSVLKKFNNMEQISGVHKQINLHKTGFALTSQNNTYNRERDS